MNNSKLNLILFLSIILFSITACDDDDPEIPNEEEVITSLIYTLSPTSGGGDITFSFQDLDGDGGVAPIISSAPLVANTTYDGSLSLLNELESPAENINEEIEEEADEHQFFFASTVAGLSVNYEDTDLDNNPIGLLSTLTTGDSGTGTLTITLRHEPNKTASGVASGDISNAGGETDIEVTFDIIIQ